MTAKDMYFLLSILVILIDKYGVTEGQVPRHF